MSIIHCEDTVWKWKHSSVIEYMLSMGFTLPQRGNKRKQAWISIPVLLLSYLKPHIFQPQLKSVSFLLPGRAQELLPIQAEFSDTITSSFRILLPSMQIIFLITYFYQYLWKSTFTIILLDTWVINEQSRPCLLSKQQWEDVINTMKKRVPSHCN